MRFIALAPLVLALMGFAMPVQNLGAPAPGDVKGGASQLDGKIKSTVAGTHVNSDPVPHNALGSRTVAGGSSSVGGIAGNVGHVAGAATGKGSGGGKLLGGKNGPNGVVGAAKGAGSGTTGKLGGVAGNAGSAGGLVSRQGNLKLTPGDVESTENAGTAQLGAGKISV